MKIVIVIADINKAGGTERATVTLSNQLSETHEVVILSLGKEGKPFFKLDKKVTLSSLGLKNNPKSFSEKIFWYLQLYKKIKIKLKNYDPHIIIGEGHNISSLLPIVKNKSSRTIACEHIDYDSIPKWSQNLMNVSYPKLNCLVALSNIAKNKIDALNKNTIVIPNSLPFEVLNVSELDNKKLIMVGRISEEKGYERLVPIAKRLQQEFPEWVINIYGDGPLKKEIQELYHRESLTNIIINKPVDEIKNKYLQSSVHLITSYHEAMPMVILEAQYCGLPVVGFRCEGTESLIKDGVNGFIVDSPDEFYKKLKLLIVSKERRREIGIKGRETSELYNSKNVKLKWEKLINSLN